MKIFLDQQQEDKVLLNKFFAMNFNSSKDLWMKILNLIFSDSFTYLYKFAKLFKLEAEINFSKHLTTKTILHPRRYKVFSSNFKTKK